MPFVKGSSYVEPCCGDGSLIDLLYDYAKCVGASDIASDYPSVSIKNALDYTEAPKAEFFITNPPYSWPMLKPLLDHLPTLLPTWLLLPADLMHNQRMSPYMSKCCKVVSVGRLYWMDNKVKGVDNFCWYEFTNCPTVPMFWPRSKKPK